MGRPGQLIRQSVLTGYSLIEQVDAGPVFEEALTKKLVKVTKCQITPHIISWQLGQTHL